MSLFGTIETDIKNLIAWIEHLFAHQAAGTLPIAPVAGGPAVSLPPAAGASTSPPATVTVAGIDTPDANGAVKLLGVSDPTFAAKRWLCLGALPALTKGSRAYAIVVLNTANAKLEESMGTLISVGKKVVEAIDPYTGNPTYGPDTSEGQNIDPAIFVVPAEYTTIDAATAYVNACAARAATIPAGGGGFSPAVPK
jgi:hypothetical protein